LTCHKKTLNKKYKGVEMNTLENATLELLLEKNNEFIEIYKQSKFMQFIKDKAIHDIECRDKFLAGIQVLSNYFQKHIFLRFVFTDNKSYINHVLIHLKEEFLHNEKLMAERDNKMPLWDPILESTCSWFAWRMFNTNDEEKIVLVHIVLETGANIFFTDASSVMSQFGEHDYFKKHAEEDENHEKMGRDLLIGLNATQYRRLIEVQAQGWKILLTALNRIAELATDR
jgi:hypothetical protein